MAVRPAQSFTAGLGEAADMVAFTHSVVMLALFVLAKLAG